MPCGKRFLDDLRAEAAGGASDEQDAHNAIPFDYQSRRGGHTGDPSSRDTVRAVSRRASMASAGSGQRAAGTTRPMAPVASPEESKTAAAAAHSPSTASSASVAIPDERICFNWSANTDGSMMVSPVMLRRSSGLLSD